MTLQQLIREKGPYVVADEIQYRIQHHVGLKLPYLSTLLAVQNANRLPEVDLTLEEFIDSVIIAMHEGRKTGYLDIP